MSTRWALAIIVGMMEHLAEKHGRRFAHNFIAIGKNLYFVADDGSTGEELWVSDGTSAGTHRAKDIYSGTTGSEPYELTVMDGKLYFGANDLLMAVNYGCLMVLMRARPW